MPFVGHFCPHFGRTGGKAGARQPLFHVETRARGMLFRTDHSSLGPRRVAADWRNAPPIPGSIEVLERLDLAGNVAGLNDIDGDFAFAWVDEGQAVLVLGLAPLSELELHYRVADDGTVRFATDLRDLIGEREAPDIAMFGKALHFDAFFDADRGFYKGVRPVHPGTVVKFRCGRLDIVRFWDPLIPERRSLTQAEAAQRLRSALECSVQSRLEAIPGGKGSLLSAGRDSSAVTAVAAKLLAERNEWLDTWTAGSLPGPEEMQGCLLDEAPVASMTASRFANVRHHVILPQPIDLCSCLDRIHQAMAVPVIQPLAVAWCESVWNASASAGNRLLLSGDFGNYALSAGGPVYLDDVRREQGLFTWASAIAAGLAAAPPLARPFLSGLLGRHRLRAEPGQSPLLPFLRGALLDARREAGARSEVRFPSYRRWLRQGFRVAISPNDMVQFDRPLELTDPTRDRRVVDLVNSLPASMLAGPSDRRALFEAAFGDLLPRPVLRPKARGRQNVDWHHTYRPSAMLAGLNRYEESALVRSMINCDELRLALQQWPTARTLSGPVHEQMVWGALPALSMASFLFTRDN